METKITTRLIHDASGFITVTYGDVVGMTAGTQWDESHYKYDVYDHYFDHDYWCRYSIRNGTYGENAYENGELAQLLNKKMDSLDKKGTCYYIRIENKAGRPYVFSNVYATENGRGKIYTGARRASSGQPEIPQYLPTPTF